MSLMQQRMWYVEQGLSGDAKAVFNLCSAQRLSGPLQRFALDHAVRALVHRHAALRTVMGQGADGHPVQCVQAAPQGEMLAFEDLSRLEEPRRQGVLEEKIVACRNRPFDVISGPLYRFVLFKLAALEHVLVSVTHHLISDGWSMWVISQDLSELYAAACEEREARLPELSVTVLDHAAWQSTWLGTPEAREELDYWAERLDPLPEALNLPTDRPRTADWSGKSGSVLVALPLSAMASLRQCARESQSSVFTWLLATYFVLLSRLSGQHDLVVGIPVKGRRDKELAGVVGFFVNTLPLRFSFGNADSFDDITRSLKAVLQQALDHAEVPLAQLVQRLALPRHDAEAPVYQTLFSFLDLRSRTDQWGGLHRQAIPVPTCGGTEDVSVLVIERKEDVCVEFCFNEDVFSRPTVELMARRYVALLEAAMAQPAAKTCALPLMDKEEMSQVCAWSQSASRCEPDGFLPEWIAARIQAHPDAVALVDANGRALSYGQLGQRAARVAHWIGRSGWQRGDRVAVLLDQGTDAVVAMLGILAAGLTYVPLDPQCPSARLHAMLEDSGACGVVTVSGHADYFADQRLPTLLLDVHEVAMDAVSAGSSPWPAQTIKADDTAYVLYTSGSTGVPKGVLVPHRALANFAVAMQRVPGIAQSDRVLSVTTPSFDISILELLVPLAVGAQVVIVSTVESRDGEALARLLAQHRITVMQATPSSWRLLVACGWAGQAGLRALVGGEAFPADLAQQLLARVDEVWNMYGPTETTIWSTCGRILNPQQGIHVGRPIANTSVRIVDIAGQLCPVGVPGEIWIGGAGLAQGYLNRAEATKRGFVTASFPGDDAEPQRMYRTGDLGRWRLDGNIECLGRQDRQIKVRGVRIEPGDIEHQLAGHPQVAACLVSADTDDAGSPRLVAYVVPKDGAADATSMQGHLRQLLPASMVPSHFYSVEAIPLLPNGKIDRVRLHAQASSQPVGELGGDGVRQGDDELTTETQRQLAAIWKKLLGVSTVGAQDNFFDLGGHSLLVMQSIALMEAAIGKRVSPRHYVFESLAQLAAAYDKGVGLPSDLPVTAPATISAAPKARGFTFFRRKR
ncbi:MAG: amino acid adenylation domain-containing protein [Burkholderiales bacterium]|nr:amino acid adenylation domain-containing protein [Burkholderiales bacterium]